MVDVAYGGIRNATDLSPGTATDGQYLQVSGSKIVGASGTGSTISPASTVTGPDAFGASAAGGSSTNYARAPHDHG